MENEAAGAEHSPGWPTTEEQLAGSKIIPGSALEKLVRENQDFHMLRPEEANDRIRIPLWARVHWRKHHPEGKYSADDPTGGYPLALRDMCSWMIANQDLKPAQGPDPKTGG